ncbi:MAG: DUF2244 domain-containing protein [Roseovarius sp.]|nr:DUF2244 domain-containing protein [Roseovarius sp.]
MPYVWSATSDTSDPNTLELWPHRSLPRKGFAAFILGTFTLITIPLYGLLGTALVWGLLPFLMLTVAGLWWGLEHSYKTARVQEVLTLDPEMTHLVRTNPSGEVQEWECNSYWVQVALHAKGGPVENYVTLSGKGREVEIGAFLSEDERKALYGELSDTLRRVKAIRRE